jgi:uncharacterized protein (UPF0548 family)
VAVGDFNGDGIPDLAVANYGDNNVRVRLGNGDGTFQAGRNFRTGSNPRSVAVGDFNGDGILDLVVANESAEQQGTVSVLLGNGDGTFQAARNFFVGLGPSSVAVGDFNSDGRLDLVVANQDSDTVSVLLGNGDGTFQAARNRAAGRGPYSVVVVDVNGDGKPDLAVANRYSDNVSVLVGNGDGTFQAARNFPAGRSPRSVAVGDFNGDSIPDLAVANGLSDDVSVLLGNGDGTFQAARNFAAGMFPESVAVGDVNGDGLLDLVVTSGTVRVLLGNGDGTFQTTHVSYVAGSFPISVAIEDFNGDARPDLAVANADSDDVSILDNDGKWPSAPGGGSRPHAGRRGLTLPALAGLLPPRPDPLVLPALPNRGTEAALPPPGAALDNLFTEAHANSFAGVTPRRMLARSPVTWLPFLDSDFPWADVPEWVA